MQAMFGYAAQLLVDVIRDRYMKFPVGESETRNGEQSQSLPAQFLHVAKMSLRNKLAATGRQLVNRPHSATFFSPAQQRQPAAKDDVNKGKSEVLCSHHFSNSHKSLQRFS